jgi:ribosomal protein L24
LLLLFFVHLSHQGWQEHDKVQIEGVTVVAHHQTENNANCRPGTLENAKNISVLTLGSRRRRSDR